MRVNTQLRLVKKRTKGSVGMDVSIVGEPLLKGKIRDIKVMGNTILVLTTDEQNPLVNLGERWVPPAARPTPVATAPKRKAGRPPKNVQAVNESQGSAAPEIQPTAQAA